MAEDLAAVAGLSAAFLGVLASDLWLASWCDALGSIVVGLILAVVAVFLASESRKLLVGESGAQSLLDDVRRLALDERRDNRHSDIRAAARRRRRRRRARMPLV